MKKIVSIALCAVFTLSFANADAKIRRLGYPGIPTSIDFNDLQKIINASAKSDTIYVFPGDWGTATLSRRAVFIGFGSNLGNTGLQNISGTSTLQVDLYPGSDSTIFEGLDGLYVQAVPGQGKGVDDIIVRRCHCNGIDMNDQILTGWVISQCYIDNNPGINYSDGGQVKNWIVENSFITVADFGGGIYGGSTAMFYNDIFYQGLNFADNSFDIRNCIFTDVGSIYYAENSTYFNNVSTQADIPLKNGNGTATNNKINIPNNKIFVGYPNQGGYSYDGRFAIKEGSVAETAGENGSECGIFGGSSPFKLNCIPPIPAFYKLSAPSGTADANPYTITFSVRGNN